MIFVGSYTQPTDSCPDAKGDGICVYTQDWKLVQTIQSDNPSYLLIDKDKLYTVNETQPGFVETYQIENDIRTAYNLHETESSNGDSPCHISLFNNKLLICNYQGNISLLGDNITVIGINPHSSVCIPHTDTVLVSDLGQDTLTIYNSDLIPIKSVEL
jgi:6-phosphogluconolactonase (cycloisomerase 2 family)